MVTRDQICGAGPDVDRGPLVAQLAMSSRTARTEVRMLEKTASMWRGKPLKIQIKYHKIAQSPKRFISRGTAVGSLARLEILKLDP